MERTGAGCRNRQQWEFAHILYGRGTEVVAEGGLSLSGAHHSISTGRAGADQQRGHTISGRPSCPFRYGLHRLIYFLA